MQESNRQFIPLPGGRGRERRGIHPHKMNKDTKSKIKSIFWDYNIDPDEIYETVIGKRKKAGPFDSQQIFIRMLERLSWYELIDILGLEFIKNNLTEDVIKKVRFKALRERYETARNVLHGHPLPFSGWDPPYREKIKHTLLSNRWYRAQQALL